MKTQTKKIKNQKKIIKIVIITIISLLSLFICLESFGVTHFFNNPGPTTVQNEAEKKVNTDIKKAGTENNSTNTNTDTNTTTWQDHSSDDIKLTAVRENDGNVTIITQLTNYSDGTCNLTIEGGNSTYTQTADVMYQPSFSTCMGFSVPSNAVSKGTWQITLTVTSKGKTSSNSTLLEVL